MLSKVLVVEDSTLQTKMYQMLFKTFPGCQLVFAFNGLEAMDKLALEKDIDLIILDINLPKMDGLSFLDTMFRDGYGHIPVIVISTEDKEQDIRKALEAGAKAYVKKPWKPAQVREIINKVIAGK